PSPLSTRPSSLRPIRSEDRPCALHRPLGDLPLHPFSTISSRRGQTAFNIEALGTLEDETQLSLHTAGWDLEGSPIAARPNVRLDPQGGRVGQPHWRWNREGTRPFIPRLLGTTWDVIKSNQNSNATPWVTGDLGRP